MSLKLEYSHSKTYNFGDNLNPWLWPKLLGGILGESQGAYFLGIGTILTERLINEKLAGAQKIVIFSSGVWGHSLPTLTDNCDVYGVRGPRTAKYLGLAEELVVGDGAYLLTQVSYPKAQKVKGKVAFIPHHKSEDYIDWNDICTKLGITFISAKQPVEDFLLQIQECEYVIAEAMHGAITADVLRIPWIGVTFSPLFEKEKWFDFAEAMKLELNLQALPFTSSYKLPMFKNIEHVIRKKSSVFFKHKIKWKNLPVIWRRSSKHNVLALEDKLTELKESSLWQLSRQEDFDFICQKQAKTLDKLKSDFSES
ncbi:polysaccharide pyruvyl transferase family protein [Vibrio rumoiensis]|uniref:Succinoglycan biosynthesis protein exov n=1 Tax=Vibrio rumoiensis 1S-45 TaxID=1188252 RepID=A0A1E5E6I2_9VIBR|nr:polysaccharide pyruvyl transferase family protein [Vibrio rumoiensis]OEF29474.1 succinoglycan biosynthesis protein exov [Vibrio rumoiensis 1S-45]